MIDAQMFAEPPRCSVLLLFGGTSCASVEVAEPLPSEFKDAEDTLAFDLTWDLLKCSQLESVIRWS